MMANNKHNIFDERYRKNFLKIADYKTLNEYLKNMEKLSKKGPKYLAMYNADLEYMLGINDNYFQDGGNIFNLLTGRSDVSKRLLTEQPVCDTEGYITKINSLAQNSYCTFVTQQTKKCDNRCESRLEEMKLIQQVLKTELTCQKTGNDWQLAIKKFIDIIICCGDLFSKDEYEIFRTIYFKEISKLIVENSKYLIEAYNYLSKILKNERNKISEEFIKKYSELKKNKKQHSSQEYKDKKDKLIKEYIEKNGRDGFSIVYTSTIVEKILNSYKNFIKKKH